MNDGFDQLVSFTIQCSGVSNEQITRATRLYDDLGIYGDDATEFIVSFGKEFGVDVSGFMAADYFKGDGLDLFDFGRKTKTLTVGHLELAIRSGRLDEKTIQGN